MKKMNIREVRAILGRVDEVLGKEGEILLTRRGRPVARLLPTRGPGKFPDHADLRARMPMVKVPSEVLLREERDRD